MGRIIEAQRISTVDALLGHYTEAEVVNGGPILIAVGVGRPQVLAKRNQYLAMQEELVSLTETQLPMLIAERAASAEQDGAELGRGAAGHAGQHLPPLRGSLDARECGAGGADSGTADSGSLHAGSVAGGAGHAASQEHRDRGARGRHAAVDARPNGTALWRRRGRRPRRGFARGAPAGLIPS